MYLKLSSEKEEQRTMFNFLFGWAFVIITISDIGELSLPIIEY